MKQLFTPIFAALMHLLCIITLDAQTTWLSCPTCAAVLPDDLSKTAFRIKGGTPFFQITTPDTISTNIQSKDIPEFFAKANTLYFKQHGKDLKHIIFDLDTTVSYTVVDGLMLYAVNLRYNKFIVSGGKNTDGKEIGLHMIYPEAKVIKNPMLYKDVLNLKEMIRPKKYIDGYDPSSFAIQDDRGDFPPMWQNRPDDFMPPLPKMIDHTSDIMSKNYPDKYPIVTVSNGAVYINEVMADFTKLQEMKNLQPIPVFTFCLNRNSNYRDFQKILNFSTIPPINKGERFIWSIFQLSDSEALGIY